MCGEEEEAGDSAEQGGGGPTSGDAGAGLVRADCRGQCAARPVPTTRKQPPRHQGKLPLCDPRRVNRHCQNLAQQVRAAVVAVGRPRPVSLPGLTRTDADLPEKKRGPCCPVPGDPGHGPSPPPCRTTPCVTTPRHWAAPQAAPAQQ